MTPSNQRTQGGKTIPFSEGQFVTLGPRPGGVIERTLVVTVTVAVMGVLPSSITLAGDMVQVESGGKLLQLNVTLPLNPFWGVTVTV
jgi:hypothetical protein